MKISVLTPTYNRGYTLSNLYNSLLDNISNDVNIEWLIMDDGSTDDTEILVNNWIKEEKITIKYFKQANSGKMMALNNLLEHITGDLTVECDSDDYFTNDAFKTIVKSYPLVKSNNKIIGLALLRIYKDNKVVGTKFKEEKIRNIFDIYFKDRVLGDKVLVFKSDIRKKYKHILENNETFATEGRMYHKLGKEYDGFLCLNLPVMYCEYLPDGYTKNIKNIFIKSKEGHYKYYLEMFDLNMHKLPIKSRLHIIKHYILFSYLTNKSMSYTIKNTKGILNKVLTTILVIPGYIMSKRKFR